MDAIYKTLLTHFLRYKSDEQIQLWLIINAVSLLRCWIVA